MFTQQVRILVPMLVLLITGCTSLPADLGRGDVASLVEARGTAAPDPDETAGTRLISDLTGKPLTADSAVRIALINNPRLKAEYARLGVASAEVYDAGRLSNPTFSAAWLNPSESGAADQVTYGLTQSFTDILLLSARSRLAKGEFERTKHSVGREIQNLATDVQSSFYRLVGANQVAAMRETVHKAASVSAELAQRFFDAGNVSRLELAQEQAAASEARLQLLQAEANVAAARADLNSLLGFADGKQTWEVVEALSMPVAQEDELNALQEIATKNRLDIASARTELELLADSLGVTRRYRLLGLVEVGVETERETDRSRLTGPTLALQLPIFNQGKGAVTRAESMLARAEAEYQSLQIDASNAVQLAYAGLQNSRQRAEHYRTALIPQREAIVQRTLEQVNYMLRGQFELLFAKQNEYDAYQGYLEAVRDYWLARVELAKQVGTRLPSDSQITTRSVDVEQLITPKDTGMDHSGQRMKGMDHSGHQMKEVEMPEMDMPGMDHTGHDMMQKKPVDEPTETSPHGEHQ